MELPKQDKSCVQLWVDLQLDRSDVGSTECCTCQVHLLPFLTRRDQKAFTLAKLSVQFAPLGWPGCLGGVRPSLSLQSEALQQLPRKLPSQLGLSPVCHLALQVKPCCPPGEPCWNGFSGRSLLRLSYTTTLPLLPLAQRKAWSSNVLLFEGQMCGCLQQGIFKRGRPEKVLRTVMVAGGEEVTERGHRGTPQGVFPGFRAVCDSRASSGQ